MHLSRRYKDSQHISLSIKSICDSNRLLQTIYFTEVLLQLMEYPFDVEVKETFKKHLDISISHIGNDEIDTYRHIRKTRHHCFSDPHRDSTVRADCEMWSVDKHRGTGLENFWSYFEPSVTGALRLSIRQSPHFLEYFFCMPSVFGGGRYSRQTACPNAA